MPLSLPIPQISNLPHDGFDIAIWAPQRHLPADTAQCIYFSSPNPPEGRRRLLVPGFLVRVIPLSMYVYVLPILEPRTSMPEPALDLPGPTDQRSRRKSPLGYRRTEPGYAWAFLGIASGMLVCLRSAKVW
jgi:hypothetical protein